MYYLIFLLFCFSRGGKMLLHIHTVTEYVGLSGWNRHTTKNPPSICSSYGTGTNPRTAFRHYFRVGLSVHPSLVQFSQFSLLAYLFLLSKIISCTCLSCIIFLENAWNLVQLFSFLVTASIKFSTISGMLT